VPLIPSNPVNSASPISVTLDVSFSNCQDSVALGRITREPLTNIPNIKSEIILTVGNFNTPSSTLGRISRMVTLLKRNKILSLIVRYSFGLSSMVRSLPNIGGS